MVKNLNQIYNQYGTDKGDFSNFEHNAQGHQYGYFYQPYFEKYMDRYPNILEIGVYQGASMLAHNVFFDGRCNIVGIDVDNYLTFDINLYPNMRLMLKPSESPELLDILGDQKFDIIIDDASHTYDNQFYNIIHYSKLLSPGGIYILEDLHTNVDPQWMSNTHYGLINSPLLNLLNYKESDIIEHDEYEWLRRNITSINLSITPCELDSPNKYEQFSMTAVITFRQPLIITFEHESFDEQESPEGVF